MDLVQVDERIQKQASGVVADLLEFDSIDPDLKEPPPAWIDEMGAENALRKFRRVKAGQIATKDAPMGAKTALHIAMAGVKARAEGKNRSQLNVVINLTSPEGTDYKYPTLDVEAKE